MNQFIQDLKREYGAAAAFLFRLAIAFPIAALIGSFVLLIYNFFGLF